MSKKLKRYELTVAASGTLYVTVEAASPREAERKFDNLRSIDKSESCNIDCAVCAIEEVRE